MDRDPGPEDQNTDVNVVVDPGGRTLTWIPRDLFSKKLGDRINSVFRLGGDQARYREIIADVGFRVEHSVIIWPKAVCRAIEGVSVLVPINKVTKYLYPLTPWQEMKRGGKKVEFSSRTGPLSGERIHQWIGARTRLPGSWSYHPYPDFDRCLRQQRLIRVLLDTGFKFSRLLGDGFKASGPGAIDELKKVNRRWGTILFDKVVPKTINGTEAFARKG